MFELSAKDYLILTSYRLKSFDLPSPFDIQPVFIKLSLLQICNFDINSVINSYSLFALTNLYLFLNDLTLLLLY